MQSFFLLHSLGGGTGSGLGTRLLGMLEDEYSGVYRFAASVFPQEGGGDVVTGDYNAVSENVAPHWLSSRRFAPCLHARNDRSTHDDRGRLCSRQISNAALTGGDT